MKVNTAFDSYQATVNAPPEKMTEARRRRDLLAAAFGDETDTVRPSGSLARGTQHDPIKDVDTLLVFDAADFPDWGQPGESAQDALDHVAARIKDLLGKDGTHAAGEVRLIKTRNHSVKCFLDDPDADDPFTVDATPALRQADGTLLIPESRSSDWILTDPGRLIDDALAAHAEGRIYAPMVRVVKRWRRRTDVDVKSLYMELLAYECMPKTGSRQDALAAFFTAAALRVFDPVCDPAGLCGPVQPDVDAVALSAALSEAAAVANAAVQHEGWGEENVAVAKWGEIFGPDFPKADGGSGGTGTGGGGGLGGLGGAAAVPGVGVVDVPERTVKDINQG